MFGKRQTAIWILAAAVLAVAAGGCGGETNPAMKLQFADRVYVPVDPGALSSDGGVTGFSNLRSWLVYEDADFGEAGAGPAVVLYSSTRYMPSGTAYVAARVKVALEAAVAAPDALGVVVNPDRGGSASYLITKQQVRSAIPRVMDAKPLNFEVTIAE